MSLQMSTGAKRRILDEGFRNGFEDSLILLFSGTPPTDPDSATNASNVLVARAGIDQSSWVAGTLGAFGIDWLVSDAAGLMLPVDIANIEAQGIADGTARWFWLIENEVGSDSLLASTTIARIQGTVAVGGGDLRLTNAVFSNGSESRADTIEMYFK